MSPRITDCQRKAVLELLVQGCDRETIAALVGITPGQVSAVVAHVKMGTYKKHGVPDTVVEFMPSRGRKRVYELLEEIGTTNRRSQAALNLNRILIGVDAETAEKLLREGRKFGLGLILASQQPEDFSSVAFANTATKMIFQVGDDKSVVSRRLARKVVNSHSFAEIAELITRLPRGWAYFISENVGRVVRIHSFKERMAQWHRRSAL
jgi:hypothetical protein